MSTKKSLPILFWIVTVLLLFWSLADLAVFFIDYIATDTVNGQSVNGLAIQDAPQWCIGVLAVSVCAGAGSCILMLWRKKIAVTLALISFVAVLIDIAFTQFAGSIDAVHSYNWNLLYLVLFFDLTLVAFTFLSQKKGWIS